MGKITCPSIDKVPDDSPCQESFPGLENRIFVVNKEGKEIDPEILQRIAVDMNVSINDIIVVPSMEMIREAMLCPQVPDVKTLDELHIRDYMKAPELTLYLNDRDDSRPWYNRFDNKRKGRG